MRRLIRLLFIGSLRTLVLISGCSGPVKLRLEAHYSVIRPDDCGSEWVIRLQMTPVIPNPSR
ncbi:MAG: hypothetical protein ACYS67_17990 [Planctomycetota bacterium]